MSERVNIAAQIAEVDRELALRRSVYPGLVSRGKMRQAEADLHTHQLAAVKATLEFCRDHESEIRAEFGERKLAVAGGEQ